MIDEKKLIAEIREKIYPEKFGERCNSLDVIYAILQLIDEQPKVNEWIPCSERLPDEEYQDQEEVDWSKVKTDDPILVSVDGQHWNHKHFAEYRNGRVYVFYDGATSWTTNLKTEWPYAKLAEPQE